MLARHRRSRIGEEDVVVVTGASRGVGLEVCRRFSEGGASVGLIARDGVALAAAREQMKGPSWAMPVDVSDRASLEHAMSQIESRIGPISVLVNSAGHGHWGAVVDCDPGVFERAIAVNYLGAVYATGHVLPGMLRRGRGHIVNVGSIAGRVGTPFEAAYSASKFALVGYSEALAIEVGGTGVRVSLVNPGGVDTGFFEQRGHPYGRRWPRLVTVDRVADAVVDAVERDRYEQFLPRWLAVAHVVKSVAPPVHRLGIRRAFTAERRRLERRLR